MKLIQCVWILYLVCWFDEFDIFFNKISNRWTFSQLTRYHECETFCQLVIQMLLHSILDQLFSFIMLLLLSIVLSCVFDFYNYASSAEGKLQLAYSHSSRICWEKSLLLILCLFGLKLFGVKCTLLAWINSFWWLFLKLAFWWPRFIILKLFMAFERR